MIDIYGSPLPLKAVQREPWPTLMWALAQHSVRVHVAWSDAARTLCDLAKDTTHEKIAPDAGLFCMTCIERINRA